MTPLVLVHGFMGGGDQWAPQAPLAEHRPVIALDLPGFGRNAAVPPLSTIPDMAAWALEAVTEQGVAEFDLLGHSMGGMIAQAMIHQAPQRIRRLVLYATGAVGLLPDRFEPIETSMERARLDGAEATARRIAATWFLNGTDAAGYPHCADIAAQSRLPAILAGLSAMRDWSGVDHLPGIASETLILWGDRDRTYGFSQIERLWREIPATQLAVVPGAAHAVHLERPALFNEILDTFLMGN